jgi:Flp pilus assembly pilin Flp
MIAFLREEHGVTTIEYGLIAALVTVGAITSMDRFGQSLEDNHQRHLGDPLGRL